jgi:hypothetical protein
LIGGANGTTDSNGVACDNGYVEIDGVTYAYTGAIEYWIVPATAVCDITAAGAQGGGGSDVSGGYGASAGGDILLEAGERLAIVVGGAGESGYVYSLYAGGGAAAVSSTPPPFRKLRPGR